VKIVWDEPKRLANLDKHGLDFADLNETFFDNAVVLPSHNKANRWVAVGVTSAASSSWCSRGLATRGVSIISMRPASRNERKLYEER
jgi:uncharacterized protein